MQNTMMAVGVDMGSSRLIVAVAKKGGVEILCNESSYRLTPAVVGFGQERVVGDQAKGLIKKNFKNSVRYPMRFLTPRASDYNLEREFSFSRAKVNERDAYKEMIFNVKYKGQQTDFSSRQVVAGLFAKIKDILEVNNSNVKDLVVSVPSFFTQTERQAVVEAARVAGMKVERLYNESTANVMNYGIFRKKDLNDDKPRIVGFVDMGHAKTSVFFAKIWKSKAQILFEKNLINVGTRNFDLNMLELYLKKFEDQNNMDDHRDSPKVRIRLLDAIEKQRKILSANNEASCNIECMFDDLDFFYTMQREEFEKLNETLIDQIRDLLLNAMTESKLKLSDLHSVEIIGGGARTPIVQNMITEIMGKPVSKTLDASESISRGCAIKSAMVSPLFRVVDYEIKDRSHYAIKVGIKYKNDEKETVKTVFKEGSAFDNVVSMTINRNEEVLVRLFYEDKYDNNNLVLISTAELPASNPTTEDYKCKLYFELDCNGFAKILKYEITEKSVVAVEPKKSEKIEEEKPEKEGEEKKDSNKIVEEKPEEPKTKEIFKTRKIQFRNTNYLESSEKDFAEMVKVEEGIRKQKEEMILTQKAKYNLESFIYETRDEINNDANSIYLKGNEKEAIRAACMEKEQWLYNEGREAQRKDYVENRENLFSTAEGLYGRKEKHVKLNGFVNNAKEGFSGFYDKNKDAVELLNNDQRKAMEKDFNKGMEMVGEMFVVYNNISADTLDNYNYDMKSKEINRLFQNILDTVHEARKKEKERLRKIEEEKKKKEAEEKKKKEEEEKKKKEEEAQKSEPIEEETQENGNKIQTEE
jgi:molecular chaperone DnaK (HSP70)